MGTISHSTIDTDKTIASDNRKIQEPSGVKMLCYVILQITPKATIGRGWESPSSPKKPIFLIQLTLP